MSFTTKLLDILSINATAAKEYIDKIIETKQDKIVFDAAPKSGSSNLVTSDGIRRAIDSVTPRVDLSNYPTKNGTGATGTWPISISGAATKASQDSNGKVIADTYLKKAGDTAAGDITAPNFIGHLKGNADSATKATNDNNGLLISENYFRKYSSSAFPIGTSYNDITAQGVYPRIDTGNDTNNRVDSLNQYTTAILIGEGWKHQLIFDTAGGICHRQAINNNNFYTIGQLAYTGSNVASATKLQTARKINITGNATGSASFDGSGDVNISTAVNESKHAAAADTLKSTAASEVSSKARPVWLSDEVDNTKQVVSPNLTYTCSTKTLTAANFKGHLAGNADNATNDGNGANIASTYLKKSGGTMTGALNFANATKNIVGDDVAIGDFNRGGTLGVQGESGNSSIMLIKNGAAWSANSEGAIMMYNSSTQSLDFNFQ